MRRLLIVSLLVVPSLAVAQRGGGSRSQATRHESSNNIPLPTGPSLRIRDIEDMNPIKLLIDKRKDLKLTDAQLNALKTTEPQLKDKNDQLFKAVDSLVHEMRPGLAETDESRARIRTARTALMNTIGDVTANYDAAAKDAVAALDPEQQTKANELLAKQREEGRKNMMEKLGGGRRGGEPL